MSAAAKVANPLCVSREEAAGYLGVGVDQIDQLVQDCAIPYLLIGARKVFSLTALEQWSNQRAWDSVLPRHQIQADPPIALGERRQRRTKTTKRERA